MNRFVNPYQFVPLGEPPERRTPPGHTPASVSDRFCGSVSVSWTLVSPLLLPMVADDEGWVSRDSPDADRGTVAIPGSAIKGVVRSVHEALFNGCFRVVDEDFVPGYRAAAKAEGGWTLAIVTEIDDGARPTKFQLCDPQELVWVDALQLARKWPRTPNITNLPQSGQLVYIEGEVLASPLDRYEIAEVRSVEVQRVANAGPYPAKGGQIFLVTDTEARPKRKRNRQPARCLWASSVLTSREVAFAPLGADSAVWNRFDKAAAGGEDRRVLERDFRASEPGDQDSGFRSKQQFDVVRWQGHVVGRRARRTGFFFRGDVLWVKEDDNGRIVDLKLSVIWREPGEGPVKDRLNGHEPCLSGEDSREPSESLPPVCFTCATFGAADTGGQRRGKGKQESYAGHVRFGGARTTSQASLRRVEALTPMGAPKPGSGMFYLDLDPMPSRLPRNDLPTRWGGSLDQGARQPVRGRKFYWHSDPDAQAAHWSQELGRPVAPRYIATSAQRTDRKDPTKKKEMVRPAWLVEPGTTLTAEVTFEMLPREHVAALVAALDPARLASLGGRPEASLAVHLGGGKPLGLGSATVALTDFRMSAQKDRYTAPAGQALPLPVLDEDWLSRIDQLAGPTVRRNLPIMVRLLDLLGTGKHVNEVTYPPSAQWRDVGRDEFVKSYAFFMNANGQQLRDRRRDWYPLPRPEAPDQSLPIVDRRT